MTIPNSSNNPQKKILVIEDETPLRLVVADKLTKANFAVLQAKDGVEGLDLAIQEQPDLILLDVEMPRMDGFTMLERLRGDNWGKDATVIILTNYDTDDELLNKIIVNQPSYYLVKNDNTLEQILEKIHEVLAPQKITSSS